MPALKADTEANYKTHRPGWPTSGAEIRSRELRYKWQRAKYSTVAVFSNYTVCTRQFIVTFFRWLRRLTKQVLPLLICS
jgi:hypothetical protein